MRERRETADTSAETKKKKGGRNIGAEDREDIGSGKKRDKYEGRHD